MSIEEQKTCISCGMPLRTAADHPGGDTSTSYCRHCAREDGSMKDYEEALAGMAAFASRTQGLDLPAAREMAAAMMAKLPAWKQRS